MRAVFEIDVSVLVDSQTSHSGGTGRLFDCALDVPRGFTRPFIKNRGDRAGYDDKEKEKPGRIHIPEAGLGKRIKESTEKEAKKQRKKNRR